MNSHPKTEVEKLFAPLDYDLDDMIDEAAADIPGPVQLRNEKEVSRLLSILDELETGKDGRH